MNNYVKGFTSGFFICLCMILLNGASNNKSQQKAELLQRLDEIEEKMFTIIKYFF